MVKACNTGTAPKLFYWILLSSLSKHTSSQPVHCILLPLHGQGLQHWNCSKTFLLDPAVKSVKTYQQSACPLYPAAVAWSRPATLELLQNFSTGSCCQVWQNIPAVSLSIVSCCRCMVKACNTGTAPKLFYWILLSSLSKHTSRQSVHCILLPLHSQGLQHWNCSKTFLLDPAVKSVKMYQQAACPLYPAAVA